MITSWLVSHLSFVLGFMLGAVVIAHLLLQRRSAGGTAAWLLLIVFAPYLGVPLYLVFGGRKLGKAAASKDAIRLRSEVLSAGESRSKAPWPASLVESLGMPAASDRNSLSLCRTGRETYEAVVDLIDRATERISMTTFLFRPDEVGKDILRRLTSRAADGVEVRLLLDAVGSFGVGRWGFRSFEKSGGRLAVFMPLLHMPFRGRANLRNHRKMMIADDRYVLAGGTNIGREYLGPGPDPPRWRDLAFVLEGPATRHYVDIFRADWAFACGERLESPTHDPNILGESIVQVVPSGPDVRGDVLYDAILSIIFSASHRVWIVTPYFVPDDALLRALTVMCRRHVDVRVVVPAKSNHPLTDLARASFLREIAEAGGKIHKYVPSMLHAKLIIVDDRVAVTGSANFDMRSLFFNYETALLVYGQRDIESLAAWVEGLFESTSTGMTRAGVVRGLAEGVVRILSPLL